jgi:glycosyltransferase involved in cell wall biosynthesis
MVEQGGRRDTRNDSAPPVSISVFFPCYNEQDNVAKVAEQAIGVLDGLHADYEILIVDDGSSDHTAEVADRMAAANPRVRVVHHPRNRGYGAALQSGFRAATKELVFYTDGDAQFDLNELPPLLPLMKEFDIVSCYRMDRKDTPFRKLGGWLWTKMNGMLFSLNLRDIDCAFKLYKRTIFDHITMESQGALIDTEILARAARKGYKITQRGVHHYPRTAGRETGGSPKVMLRAFKEVIQLRGRIVSDR